MEIHASDSEEIHQYNIAITRCHEINGCVEEILFSLKNLQLKFTMPTLNARKTKVKPRIPPATTQLKHTTKKSDVPKAIWTTHCRSLHMIAKISSDFISKSIQIKRDFEGSLKQLETIRQKHDIKFRFYKTCDRKHSVFVGSHSSCKCFSGQSGK